MRKSVCCLLLFSFAAACLAQQNSLSMHFDGKSWWAHVKFLADDSLQGRNTGSEGLRKAQAYAVEQLQKAGLEPAGTDGFYNPFASRNSKLTNPNHRLRSLPTDNRNSSRSRMMRSSARGPRAARSMLARLWFSLATA